MTSGYRVNTLGGDAMARWEGQPALSGKTDDT